MSSAPSRLSNRDVPADVIPQSDVEQLRDMRAFMTQVAASVTEASQAIGLDAVQAARRTADCQGTVIVTGVGKAGLVGQKLVATLGSTGTPSHFMHPTEAVHGDLGRVRENDLVWAFSNSGRSEEVTRIAAQLRTQSTGLIAFTADGDSPLAKLADYVVGYGKHDEACPHGLAPTSSTSVMMAVGDAIALMASRLRGFTASDFARFHPGGALGRKLSHVGQFMRPMEACRVATESISIREAMVSCSKTGRRSGAIMVTDASGVLAGIFTDSDLARLMESRSEESLDLPIRSRMTLDPHCISPETLLSDAIALISQLKISELPVIDEAGKPVGMVDITDLIALGEVVPPASGGARGYTVPIHQTR